MAKDIAQSDSGSAIDSGKLVANVLSEEGLLLASVILTEPTALSLNWGAAFSLVAALLLFWEHGYTEKLPIISGPYRFVRNPHALAIWLLSFGLAIAARSFPAILLVLILLPWLFYLDHEGNTKRMDTRLLRYRFHVPALIPTLLPFEKSPNKRFSWRRAIQVQTWASQGKLLCFFAIWAYLLVSFGFKTPWWGGLIAAALWIGMKAIFLKTKIFGFSFRKKARISPKTP